MQPPVFVPRFPAHLVRGATSGGLAHAPAVWNEPGLVCLQTGAGKRPGGINRKLAAEWVSDRIPARC